MLFLYIPIAVLMILSFNKAGLPTAWTGFSTEWYGRLLGQPEDHCGGAEFADRRRRLDAASPPSSERFWRSASSAAHGVRRSMRLLFAPMIIPDIVLAIALLSFFTLIQFTLGLHSIILAHVVFNIAFVCAVVRAQAQELRLVADRGLARSGRRRRSRPSGAITLPLILPAVVAGALLAFTLSVDEFIIAYFTAGAGQASTTLPMQIYAMIRFGVTPEINAMATIIMLVSFTLVLVAQRFNRGSIPGT